MTYDSPAAVAFTDEVSKTIGSRILSYRTGIDLAIEKGPAPIFNDAFTYRVRLVLPKSGG